MHGTESPYMKARQSGSYHGEEAGNRIIVHKEDTQCVIPAQRRRTPTTVKQERVYRIPRRSRGPELRTRATGRTYASPYIRDSGAVIWPSGRQLT